MTSTRDSFRESRFINCVDDIRAIAEKYPDLSTARCPRKSTRWLVSPSINAPTAV